MLGPICDRYLGTALTMSGTIDAPNNEFRIPERLRQRLPHVGQSRVDDFTEAGEGLVDCRAELGRPRQHRLR